MMDDENEPQSSSQLRDFLANLGNQKLPEGYKESLLYKEGHRAGYASGYELGYREAKMHSAKVIDSIRNIIDLYDDID